VLVIGQWVRRPVPLVRPSLTTSHTTECAPPHPPKQRTSPSIDPTRSQEVRVLAQKGTSPETALFEFRAITAANISELLRSLYEPSFAALPFFVRC
jgi:hypothetical protein